MRGRKSGTRVVAVIGGSGFGEKLQGQRREVQTPFGKISVLVSERAGKRIIAIKRHGEGHTTPPHKVNYKGNVWAAKEEGAEAILASTAVGVIRRRMLSRLVHALANENYKPSDLILPKDIVAFQLKYPDGTGPVTYYDDFSDGIHHTDCTRIFSREIERLLLRAARLEGIRLKKGAVLTATYGPRFETPAEIRALGKLGANLIGMTAAFEAILAKELGIPYLPVAIGTNWAADTAGSLSHEEVIEMMGRKGEEVNRLLLKAIEIM